MTLDGYWQDRPSPLLALGVAIMAISTSAILVRWSQAPNLIKAFYRVLFTVMFLMPIAILRYRDAFTRLDIKHVLAALVTGVALAVHFVAWFESLDWTSVAASVTLVQSQPIFVAIGAAIILNERVSRRIIIGICIAIGGIAIMTVPESTLTGKRPLFGNSLALLGAVMAAAYVLAGRSLRQRIALIPYVTLVYTACALVLLGVSLASDVSVDLLSYPQREWLLFLAMAVGPGLLGHTVINWALKHLESTVVSVSLLGEPLGSSVLALLLLSEVPAVPTIVGGGVVLSGIWLTIRSRQTTDQSMAAS